MFVHQHRARNCSKALLMVSVVLLLIGIGAIIGSALIHETAMNQDALEYSELSEETMTVPAVDFTQVVGESADEIRPKVSTVLQQDSTADVETVPKAENQKSTDNTSATDSKTTARDLNALKAQNSDFAGWLTIAGTNIDYPVVCSDNTDYYLTHTFNGTKSSLGTLFNLGKTDYGSSKNIAIYGHHITGGGQKMFKPLLSYKDKSF